MITHRRAARDLVVRCAVELCWEHTCFPPDTTMRITTRRHPCEHSLKRISNRHLTYRPTELTSLQRQLRPRRHLRSGRSLPTRSKCIWRISLPCRQTLPGSPGSPSRQVRHSGTAEIFLWASSSLRRIFVRICSLSRDGVWSLWQDGTPSVFLMACALKVY